MSGFVGTVMGRKVLTNFGAKYFKPVLNIIFIAIALKLLWDGLQNLLFHFQ